MKVFENGVIRDATLEEIATWEEEAQNTPEPTPTPEERLTLLEETKADKTDVDELNEALEMILTGAVE